MERNKHIILKSVFVTVSVVVLMLVTKNIMHSLHIVTNVHALIILSGAVWGYLASKVFDMLVHRKRENQVSEYLHEALEDVRKMKEITKQ